MNPVLSVRGLDKRFGAVVAADALTIDIPAGQKVSLIGANGAGKTTFVNMVTGYLQPDNGSIVLDGTDIGRRSPRSVARLGAPVCCVRVGRPAPRLTPHGQPSL